MTGRKLATAIVVGFALAGIIMLCLFFLPPFGFLWFIYIFVVLALVELARACRLIGIKIPQVTIALSAAFVFCCTYFFPRHLLALSASLFACLTLVVLRGGLSEPVDSDLNRPVSRLRNSCASLFIAIYLLLLSSFLVLPLTFHPANLANSPEHGMEFMVIFLPALSDIGGLTVGATLGRHKMTPRLSPKKSYEGLAGSLFFCMVGEVIFWIILFRSTFAQDWWKAIIVGFVGAIAGTLGDLCASVIKRDVGIKDYGNLIKGHGGVLDRTDSILLAAPCIYLLLTVFL